jgi:outer membrane lipoprotein-sorting protein
MRGGSKIDYGGYALLLFLVACVPRPTLAPPLAPLPAVTAADLVVRLDEAGAGIRSLRGLARARVTVGDRTVATSQVLLAEDPDRLRAETLSPFGTALLTLVSDGRELAVSLPGEGRFLRGPATSQNLQRFTRLPLEPADLVGILLYRPPRFDWDKALAETAPDHYRLVLSHPAGTRQVFVFDAALNLTGAAYFQEENLLLQVSYQAFRTGPPRFPATSELQIPSRELRALLEFSEFDLNPALPPERFRLIPPAGVEVEKLGEE